jgi:ABC-type antimicrobial peptide transport system permease subunit
MIVFTGVRLVAIGVIVGVAAAVLASRFIGALLFGVSPTDLGTMVAVPTALLAAAILACLVPARRAARLDPAAMLREN